MENEITRAIFVALINALSDDYLHSYDVWKHKSVNWIVTAGIGRWKESFYLWFWEDWWDKILVPEIDTKPFCDDTLSKEEMIDFILSI